VFHTDTEEDGGINLDYCLNPKSWVSGTSVPEPRPSAIFVTTVTWNEHETIVLSRVAMPADEALAYVVANNPDDDGKDED
jgi:hypothetical protein